MARRRQYSRSVQKDVRQAMREYKQGKRSRRGTKIQSREQAIAIGLSKARRKGKKVPAPR